MPPIWLDVIVCIIFLLYGLGGLYKGFFRQIFSIVGFAGAATLAYFLKDWVAGLLNQFFNLATSIATMITTKFAEVYAPLTHTISADKAELLAVVDSSPVNGIIKWFMNLAINNSELSTEASVTDIVSPFFSNIIVAIISIVIIFVLTSCVIGILNVIFNKFAKGNALGVINRVFGFCLGFVNAAIFMFIALVILNALCFIPTIGNAVLPYIENTTIFKWGYDCVNSLFMFIIK